MKITGVGFAVAQDEAPIPWPLRESAVSRRYRPVGAFAELVYRALAECVARGPIVIASCNGKVTTWDDDDWRTSFELAEIVDEQAARAAAERAELIASGKLRSRPEIERRPAAKVFGRAVASAQCVSGMHALYIARSLLAAGHPEVTVLAVDIASAPAHDNFEALRVLTDEPAPYTDRSTGFQLGEAAVALRVALEQDRNTIATDIAGPVLGHDLDGDEALERCITALLENATARQGKPQPGFVIGQGAGPVAVDKAELAAVSRHVATDAPIASALATCGHTLGASSLLSVGFAALLGHHFGLDRETRAIAFKSLDANGVALDGRPNGLRRAESSSWIVPVHPLVLCRALGGGCGALVVGATDATSAPQVADWGPRSAPVPLRDETLRRIAADVDAQRPTQPPDILVVTLECPLPPAARIGKRVLPTSVLEMTPGFIPQLVARAWGYRGPALCLVGRDPEPLLAALRKTHEHVYRLAIRGMHERDVEWIPRG
ncbi:MAG TPA: hypothetical protein VMZ53_06800 [Kofleriaceae bacterium]|nr:hypothetical protein [Kofleriaceae bacterium]